MKLSNIVDLITIKNYLISLNDNYSIDKADISECQKMVPLIDVAILQQIKSSQFKELINFEEADKLALELRIAKEQLTSSRRKLMDK